MNSEINLILVKLGKEIYGLCVDNIYRIVSFENIKKVPNTPEFITGIIKIEEKIIPVIDLIKKYNLGLLESEKNTCIVILQLENDEDKEEIYVGLIVNEVLDLIEVDYNKILPVPIIEKDNNKNGLFSGAIDYESNLILIITPNGILNQKEMNIIKNILKSKK